MGDLAEAWADAVRALGGVPAPTDLEARYSEPHRRYHDTAHVLAVVRDSAWLAGELGLPADDAALVTLAACAHDVVYAAEPGADERASAAWARERLAGVLPDDIVAEVERLVLCTLDHRPRDERDLRAVALLDADLAILGAESETYAGYVRAVRAEYAAVSDADWRVGRSAVLQGLLTVPALFRSTPAHERWEERARANMRAELAQYTQDFPAAVAVDGRVDGELEDAPDDGAPADRDAPGSGTP